uniref:Uncharacterized protein n=1 Tax=Anguilla anguilla TaxID=7936 RepID=A0A0E9T2G3_ANGAN
MARNIKVLFTLTSYLSRFCLHTHTHT